MKYNISQLAQACRGKIIQLVNDDRHLSKLLIDSRQLSLPEQTVFFAFQGHRQDGHRFIDDLYKSGVRSFIVSDFRDLSNYPDANFVEVDDVLRALQAIAQVHRLGFDIPVIGITGSNGKTVIKEWLAQLLAGAIKITKNPKSYNSQLGVALSIWLLDQSTQLGIFEAGISQPGEMDHLREMIKPTIGLFTNIGTAHDEGFSSRPEKIREKLALFQGVEVVLHSADHLEIVEAVDQVGLSSFTWSRMGKKAEVQIHIVKRPTGGCDLEYVHHGKTGVVFLPLEDGAAVENAIHCLTMILYLGFDQPTILARFSKLAPVKMRLEVLEGVGQSIIINDTYNADIESLSIALAYTNQQAQGRSKNLIISDFEQLALSQKELLRRIAELATSVEVSRVFAVGQEVAGLQKQLPPEIAIYHFQNTQELIAQISDHDFSNQLVLVKGARRFQLDRVAYYLSRQKHNAVLEVNLGALARNLKIFEARLRPQTKVMAMVKANAYGSGSQAIVKFLQTRNVDYLAVAYADEGVELRNLNCHLPIMVLNPEEESIPLLTDFHLEPEVYSLQQFDQIIKHLKSMGGQLPIHLKLETGMHRLGFSSAEIPALEQKIMQHPEIEVKSIFSHLSTSDDASQHSFARQQIKAFEHMAHEIMDHCGIKPLLHLLNSNGIYHFPEAQYDMVRLGIGIYGIGMPSDLLLEKVHTMKTRISHIRKVGKGASIGYGRAEITDQARTIATVGIGYADGLIRKAGNRRYALVVENTPAPIVGNICMDMTMLDVTGIENIATGSEVTVFGPNLPIERLAQAADTIPYEILTGLSNRIKRIYVND